MIDQEQVLEILHAIGEKITEEKLYLTELDNVIGDGDHGINLARGFAEVEKKRPMMEGKDIGTMLKTAGMALVSTVGGASGPLYGTAFMQAGKALAGKTELDAQDLLTILDAFVAGVQLRGKSVAGEKTMLDAMIPARDAFKAAPWPPRSRAWNIPRPSSPPRAARAISASAASATRTRARPRSPRC